MLFLNYQINLEFVYLIVAFHVACISLWNYCVLLYFILQVDVVQSLNSNLIQMCLKFIKDLK
jgi:hypothetical protein